MTGQPGSWSPNWIPDYSSRLTNEELEKVYQKCRKYIRKIITQQKKLGNEIITNKQLREFLNNDPNTPDWFPAHPYYKFKRLKFSIFDFTGIVEKRQGQKKSKEELEKVYQKCRKYARELIKKHGFRSESELYNFCNGNPNLPYWYQPRLFVRLGYTAEEYTGIVSYRTRNRKWISQDDLAKEIQKIIKKRKMRIPVGSRGDLKFWILFNEIKKLPEYKPEWPKQPNLIYKNFKGTSFLIFGMTTEELKFRYPIDRCIESAQILSRENNIRTIKEWSDAMITCGPVHGLPIYVKSGFRKSDGKGNLIKESQKYPDINEWLGLPGPWQYERDYEKALLISVPFCRKNDIISQLQWNKFLEKYPEKRPEKLSPAPEAFYKKLWRRERITKFTFKWREWTGSGIIASTERMRLFKPWNEAKPLYEKLCKKYNVTTPGEFKIFTKKYRKLLEELNLPLNPAKAYSKDRVWRMME